MESNFNAGFQQQQQQQGTSPSFLNRQMVSFQPGAVSTAAMNSFSGAIVPVMPAHPMVDTGAAAAAAAAGTGEASCISLVLGAVPGLKWNPGLSQDWSADEDAVLNEGLVRHANEPNIVKYLKIASQLHEKSVRDVALRCRWMTRKERGKRRKPEDHSAGKKVKDRKEKIVASSAIVNTNVVPSSSDQQVLHEEAPVLDETTRRLLQENTILLQQISSNLTTPQIVNNVTYFLRLRKNINDIQARMSMMPGIMSRMPPLPESPNDELFNHLFSVPYQAFPPGGPGSCYMNQDPKY